MTERPITVTRRQLLHGAAALAALGVTLGDTLPAGAAKRRARQTKRLVYADPFEPRAIGDFGSNYVWLREGIGQGLVWVDFSSTFQPWLAERWEMLDERTWRFHLRAGVRFHNGNLLDADTVAFNLNRLAGLKAAASAFQGATTTAESPDTVRIQTLRPAPYLLAVLASNQAMIFDRAAFAADGTQTEVIGTGPYRLVEFRPGDRRILAAHTAYWGGAPDVEEIHALFVVQGQTRVNLIRTGDADIIRVINPTDLPSLQRNPEVEVLTALQPRLRLLYPNVAKGPTSDLRVRQALALAVDREAISEGALEGEPSVQASLFRPTDPWGNPALKGLPFDPDRARSLLAEAGYGPGQPLSFTLQTYASRPELPGIAQVLQAQFADVGINCQLSIQDSSVVEAAGLRGEHDLLLISRLPLFLYDPQLALESDYTSTGSYNLSRYSAQDEAIAAAGTIADDAVRFDRVREIERRIVEEDVATIVLAASLQVDAVRRGVTGYQPHPTEQIALTERIRKGP